MITTHSVFTSYRNCLDYNNIQVDWIQKEEQLENIQLSILSLMEISTLLIMFQHIYHTMKQMNNNLKNVNLLEMIWSLLFSRNIIQHMN